jgi:hypothetical protein
MKEQQLQPSYNNKFNEYKHLKKVLTYDYFTFLLTGALMPCIKPNCICDVILIYICTLF